MKDNELTPRIIKEDDELLPGMVISNKGCPDRYRIVYAKRYRDSLVVCLNEDGHTVLIPAWDGNYVINPFGLPMIKIAYGKTPDSDLKITDEYYFNEEDFKKQNPGYQFWYVEALQGTRKIIEVG